VKSLLTIFAVILLMVLGIGLFARYSHQPQAFPADSVSAQRLAVGPWAVGEFDETFVDRSRSTQANGEFPGSDERSLEGTVWYPDDVNAGSAPLLIFSHGFTSLRENGRYLAEHLASHGYVVVAVDYPLTNMSAPGGPMFEDVVNQPGDVSFLIDSLLGYSTVAGHTLSDKIDASRIGVLGISLGGLTSTLAGYHPRWRDPRIGAVIAIAGPTNFFTPDFFSHGDAPFMMLAGELDALVPWDTNAEPVPAKVPGATLVTVAGGSHTGFSGGTAWLRWMRNTDSIGCYSVLRYIEDSDTKSWTGLFGDAQEGYEYGLENELCQLSPLPKATNVLRQQMIGKVAIRAFFDSTLGKSPAVRQTAEAYLRRELAAELADVSVVRSSPQAVAGDTGDVIGRGPGADG